MICGMLRIKNEQRWIAKVIESIQPLCDEILILDDHSTDETREICRAFAGVTVFESPFEGLNECRDKAWLLEKVMMLNPEWIVAIDGDEILSPGGQEQLRHAMKGPQSCLSLRILYLWNDWQTVRTDGVYGDFHRESVFRPNGSKFEVHDKGPNFHCGNVPWGNRINKRVISTALLHAGYMHKEDRRRKFEWYNTQDPNNALEDRYRHMVIGDLYPRESRFLYGGPLELARL